MKIIRKSIILLICFFVLSHCKTDQDPEQSELLLEDESEISEPIDENDLTANEDNIDDKSISDNVVSPIKVLSVPENSDDEKLTENSNDGIRTLNVKPTTLIENNATNTVQSASVKDKSKNVEGSNIAETNKQGKSIGKNKAEFTTNSVAGNNNMTSSKSNFQKNRPIDKEEYGELVRSSMNIYVSKESYNQKGSRRHRRDFTKVNFPVKQVKNYMKFPFARFPPLISIAPWLPIFYDKLTYQTFIFSLTGGLYIIPPLINFYGQRFAVAQLIKWGYASLVSSGVPPPPNVNVAPLVQPVPPNGPAPGYDKNANQFKDGVKTNFNEFKPPNNPPLQNPY